MILNTNFEFCPSLVPFFPGSRCAITGMEGLSVVVVCMEVLCCGYKVKLRQMMNTDLRLLALLLLSNISPGD